MRLTRPFLLALALVGLTGCKTSDYTIPPLPATVTVTVTPGTTTIAENASVTFAAAVSGSSNTAVTWTIDGNNTSNVFGTINAGGTYTAPATPGTYTVRATSQENTGDSGTAKVTVVPAAVAVTVTPGSVALPLGGGYTFSASVANATDTSVSWSVDGGAANGSITSAGAYTAPATAGVYTVRATSNQDATQSGTATVTVSGGVPAVGISVSPTAISMAYGTSHLFKATVTGSSDTSVSWSVDGGSANGSVGADGTYTAPARSGIYTLRATATADITKTATATIHVGSTLPAVGVTVTPGTASLVEGATKTFSAAVSGNADTLVVWSVDGGSVNGSITADGTYTAPAAPGTFTVRATSDADATKSGTATVTVSAPVTTTVSINPTSPSVVPGGSVAFSATVSGNANPAVTWSVQPGSSTGTIASTGPADATFSAGGAAGTCVVTATSVADNTASASTTVTITSATNFNVNPGSVAVAPGTTQQFSARFGNGTTTATWALQEGATAGSIDSTGLFTAGSTVGTYHVVATSTVDSSQVATARVTVATAVTVSIIGPATSSIASTDAVTFYSSVQPSGVDPSVSWSVTEGAAAGAVLPVAWYQGFIPAGASGTYHVVATSHADPSQSTQIQIGVSAASGSVFTAATPAATRAYHTATALSDGRIVVAGGTVDHGNGAVNSIEVYTPSANAFSTASFALGSPRIQAAAIALDSHRVLVSGGASDWDDAYGTAEVLDLTANSTTPAGNAMSAHRLGHRMVLLTTGANAGKVLVLGGFNGPVPYGIPSAVANASADLFDPATGQFTPLAATLQVGRGNFTATVLADGKVLITGGYNYTSGTLASAEIYDPVAGTFAFTNGAMHHGRYGHTATLLPSGQVLIAGGGMDSSVGGTAELYDPASGTFTDLGAILQSPRTYHAAALVGSKVLLTGGESDNYHVWGTAELVDPVAGSSAMAGHLSQARSWQTATAISGGANNGKVLVVGGQLNSSQPATADISN